MEHGRHTWGWGYLPEHQAGLLYPTVTKFISGMKTASTYRSTPHAREVNAGIPFSLA